MELFIVLKRGTRFSLSSCLCLVVELNIINVLLECYELERISKCTFNYTLKVE